MNCRGGCGTEIAHEPSPDAVNQAVDEVLQQEVPLRVIAFLAESTSIGWKPLGDSTEHSPGTGYSRYTLLSGLKPISLL